MVNIESAATVGIPSSIGSAGSPRSGIVLHYPGTPVLAIGSHEGCRKRVRDWHSMHIRSNGWAGIGYHYLICTHGIVLTGRGLNRGGAHAPGANSTHIGIQFMVSNNQDPNSSQLKAFREFREWLRARGVNANNITPHSRWISPSCPGDHIRRRISSGNWGTGGSTPPPASGGGSGDVWVIGDLRVPKGDPVLRKTSSGALVKNLQQCLMAWRPNILPKWKDDGDYGDETVSAVETFQAAHGLNKDGAYGTNSANKMREVITALQKTGVLGMTDSRTFNDNDSEQVLPRGEWVEVRLEDGKYSLAFDGETYLAHVALRVAGLVKGEELQVRFTEVRPNPGTPPPNYTRVRHLGITSPVHDGGQLHVTTSWAGKLASDRRLRVEVTHFSESEEVKITGRTASVLYAK